MGWFLFDTVTVQPYEHSSPSLVVFSFLFHSAGHRPAGMEFINMNFNDYIIKYNLNRLWTGLFELHNMKGRKHSWCVVKAYTCLSEHSRVLEPSMDDLLDEGHLCMSFPAH